MDASAAIGVSNRIGPGRVRHIEVNQLWLQGKVGKKHMEVAKVPTQENLPDALAKGVESEALRSHVQGVGSEIRRDRHDMAPTTEDEKSEE